MIFESVPFLPSFPLIHSYVFIFSKWYLIKFLFYFIVIYPFFVCVCGVLCHPYVYNEIKSKSQNHSISDHRLHMGSIHKVWCQNINWSKNKCLQNIPGSSISFVKHIGQWTRAEDILLLKFLITFKHCT